MGNSGAKNSDKEKDVFKILEDLNTNFSDAKKNIKLLQDAEAEKKDEHTYPNILQDTIYRREKMCEEAAKDFKFIAKRVLETWQFCGDARIQDKYSPKDSAAKKRKVEIQLYCAQKTDITYIAMRELEKHLTSEQFHQGMILTVKTIKTGSSISTGIPLIVICLNSSRLSVDLSNAVSEVPDKSNTVVLIFHLLKEHALPTQASNTVLTKAEVTKVGTIIDVAFWEDMGLYDCKMNRRAYTALLTFIKEHWCKTSAVPTRPPSPPSKPPPSSALLSRPWRVLLPLDQEQLLKLKKRVEDYSLPSELKAKQARILMLGPKGAGKSSFFNTINSIFQQRITGSAKGSQAMEYQQYEVQSLGTESPLNFCLCEICGVEKTKVPDLDFLNYLLEGNVPDRYKSRSTSISPGNKGFIHKPEPQDKVHCVVFIIDASLVHATGQDTWDRLSQLQNHVNTKGIPRFILLTKIDNLLESADNDMSKVFYSKDVKRAVKHVSEKLCVPLGTVMPIKNYNNDKCCNDQISCLALQALDRMLGYATDYLRYQ